MNEPWFDTGTAGWLGALIGLWGGVAGSLCGILAPRGKGRFLVLGILWGGTVLCAGFLVAGITAWCLGQPYGVWYGLGLPGLIGIAVFPPLIPVVRNAYVQAELRRLLAKDL
ncbi:MAG TPA: hypothetical protein PLA90_14450 [Candidatus Sumerlaeota bacterium]|nr:hypothetical protein [Candidatus Sumerlaeota bacterium]HPS02735.1 hypothetical protein [Candidatus Sumerlaeota bacterium]